MAYNPYETSRGRLEGLASSTRRQFLLLMGGLIALATLILGGVQSLKFLFPGATGEAPAEYKVAVPPSAIPVGTVYPDTAHRVSIVHDKDGFYAVYLVCTHLGCTPNFVTDVFSGSGVTAGEEKNKPHYARFQAGGASGWACPCHGSRYMIDSTNFYGPAPRPMDWVKISFNSDKSALVVDRASLVVKRGAGVSTPPTWRLNAETGDITPDPRFA